MRSRTRNCLPLSMSLPERSRLTNVAASEETRLRTHRGRTSNRQERPSRLLRSRGQLRKTDVGGLMAETRFEGRSPVGRYWLSKCEGFAVTGGERGVVEELIRDADPFVTTRLVVRTGRRRRAVVSAEAVAAVDPAERVVFIAPARRKQYTRTAMTRAAAGARMGSAGTAR